MSVRLNTAQSEASVKSRMSEHRREMLLNLKKREELKDALTDKLKGRFGHGSFIKADDEMSVASATIRDEVNKFTHSSANLTSSNLARLERRLQAKARPTPAGDASTVVSGYSVAASHLSRSRSVPSIAGSGIVRNQPGQPRVFEWSKLDEYASYLHEQDCVRQHLGVKALQRKLRTDLDQQVAQKKNRKDVEFEEDMEYHKNQMVELERWKAVEQLRQEERHDQIMREKADRDAQLEFERRLKSEEADKKKADEAHLVAKIVEEMEAEQSKFEKKKEQQKRSMRKVFEENALDQVKRQQEQKESLEREAAAIKEFARALDEQEQQRTLEMQARIETQNSLMKKLQENADGLKRGAGDNDAARAAAQAEEMDRHYAEAEHVKQNRLKQLRVENQAYLLKQMEEKDRRRDDDRELSDIQALILARDSEEYTEMEQEKMANRRKTLHAYSNDIKRQMAYKLAQSAPVMTESEIAMNRPLLQLVHRTLEERAANAPAAIPEGVEDEDY